MINIKSLKQINEIGLANDDSNSVKAKEALDKAKEAYEKSKLSPHDMRYQDDIAKANADYDKVAGTPGPFSLPRKVRWLLTPDKKVADAAADRTAAIDLAEARRKAAKMGMMTKEDVDEIKFQAAKSQAAARAKQAIEKVKEEDTTDKPGIFGKIGGAIKKHPLIAAGTVAGLAGLAALQKRKKRSPEPESY